MDPPRLQGADAGVGVQLPADLPGDLRRDHPGKWTLIRGAFVATMPSGHTGIFFRQGKGRLPIEEAFTSRVSDAFLDSAPAIMDRGRRVFLETMGRLLGC